VTTLPVSRISFSSSMNFISKISAASFEAYMDFRLKVAARATFT